MDEITEALAAVTRKLMSTNVDTRQANIIFVDNVDAPTPLRSLELRKSCLRCHDQRDRLALRSARLALR
jgi:hypothetical protein